MATDPSNKPHWAIPHAVGVAVAAAVYILIYAFTGYTEVLLAFSAGAASLAGTWFYLFVHLPRRPK